MSYGIRLRDIGVHEHHSDTKFRDDAERIVTFRNNRCEATVTSLLGVGDCPSIWQRAFFNGMVADPLTGLPTPRLVHLCWRHAQEWERHPSHQPAGV